MYRLSDMLMKTMDWYCVFFVLGCLMRYPVIRKNPLKNTCRWKNNKGWKKYYVMVYEYCTTANRQSVDNYVIRNFDGMLHGAFCKKDSDGLNNKDYDDIKVLKVLKFGDDVIVDNPRTLGKNSSTVIEQITEWIRDGIRVHFVTPCCDIRGSEICSVAEVFDTVNKIESYMSEQPQQMLSLEKAL